MFPMDIFQRLFEGDWVAWFGVGMAIVVVALCSLLFVLWWKLPQFAKAAFINNTVGGNRPTIAECYENKRVKFITPQLFRSGLGFHKGAWFMFPKTWATSDVELNSGERESLNSVYTIEGTQSAFFVNLSIQAQVANPELLALIQYEKQLQNLSKPDTGIVHVKKEHFLEALKMIKEDTIQLSPMHLDFPLDIRGLKTLLPKSLSKSQLVEQENKIKEDIRKEQGGFGGFATILVLIGVVAVIMDVVILLKNFGVF